MLLQNLYLCRLGSCKCLVTFSGHILWMLMCSSCVKMASLVLLFRNRTYYVHHTLLYVLHELIECQLRFLKMQVGRESGAKISPLLEFSFISLNTVCLCTCCHHFDRFNFIPFVFVQILFQRHLAFHASPVKSNLITRSYNAKLEISDIFRATFSKMLMMTLMLHDYPA